MSDILALGVMEGLRLCGYHVPEDISVIGFDDNEASRENIPSLTTVNQDAELRASMAVRLLEEMKAGEKVENKVTLPVKLVIRNSTQKRE